MNAYALIVDPDQASAATYASLVRAERLFPVCVRDGAAALTQLTERGAPALLVVDPAITHFDGFEVIERLRRTAGGERAQVIVVSADRSQRDRAVGVRARLEIGAVLAKAASDDSTKRVIQRLLGEGHAAPGPPRAVPTAGPPADELEAVRGIGLAPRTPPNIGAAGGLAPSDEEDEQPARSSWASAVKRHLSALSLRRRA